MRPCVAALDAVMDTLTDVTFTASKQELEIAFAEMIEDLADRHRSIVGFRRRGLLAAIDFNSELPRWQTFLDAGLHVIIRDNMVVLAPPFVSTRERLERAFQSLHEVIVRHSADEV